MKDSLALCFLYRTVCGRLLLKGLTRPGLSRLAGHFLDRRWSRWLIAPFQRANQISLEGIEVPEGGFPSFNAFFSRKRKEAVFDAAPNALCSPCDGWLRCERIDQDSRFCIKGSSYSVAELLDDENLARAFLGGTALILRLTPADYHRYCFIDDGEVLLQRRIPGVLHCVRPIALETVPVFIQNSREYSLFRAEHLGTFVQMEVGALLVGRICNRPVVRAVRGEEKGFFQYGGSTIILLLPPGDLCLRGEPTTDAEERFVCMGEVLGRFSV